MLAPRTSPEPTAAYDAYVKQLKMPLWEKTCFFEGGVARNVNGNMFALVRALCADEAYSEYEPVFAVTEDVLELACKRFAVYGLDRVRFLIRESDEYKEYLARSKYLFNDNTLPPYFTKREGQVYVNTWHGTPLKHLGFSDMANSLHSFANVQKNLLTADYDLFPNEYTRDILMEDYGLAPLYGGTSLVHDYPRNDVLSYPAVRDLVREEQGIEPGCQAIAYMPTWRGSGRTADGEGQVAQVSGYLREIDAALGDDQILFVNLHFLISNHLDFSAYRHVRPFPDIYETYDFLTACDALVTDYSSVMFDFAVTGRPIYLFAYDEEEYMAERGTYFPYGSLPFPVAHDTDELVAMLNDGAATSHEGYREFCDRFCSHHTGHAAASLLDLVLRGVSDGIQAEHHRAGRVDQLFYVYSLGNRKVLDAILPDIAERATADSVLVTTGKYSETAVETLKQLHEKIHIVIIVRSHVLSDGEEKMLERSRTGRLSAARYEGRLADCYRREAGRLLPGIRPDRFVALNANGSYLMWVAKGLDCPREAVVRDPDITGSKNLGKMRLCIRQGYEVTDARR